MEGLQYTDVRKTIPADMEAQQPDFPAIAADMNIVATDMHHVAEMHASIATNIGRMQNIPALNQGEAILEAINAFSLAINALSLRMDNHFRLI